MDTQTSLVEIGVGNHSHQLADKEIGVLRRTRTRRDHDFGRNLVREVGLKLVILLVGVYFVVVLCNDRVIVLTVILLCGRLLDSSDGKLRTPYLDWNGLLSVLLSRLLLLRSALLLIQLLLVLDLLPETLSRLLVLDRIDHRCLLRLFVHGKQREGINCGASFTRAY